MQTLAFNPSLQMASQSALDCSDAAGEVNSICIHHVSMCAVCLFPYVTHVVNTEVVQGLGYLNLLLSVEEGIGELFTLSQRTLDDLEARHIAQEVANRLIWVMSGRLGVCLGLDGGEAWVSFQLELVIDQNDSYRRTHHQHHWQIRWFHWKIH